MKTESKKGIFNTLDFFRLKVVAVRRLSATQMTNFPFELVNGTAG